VQDDGKLSREALRQLERRSKVLQSVAQRRKCNKAPTARPPSPASSRFLHLPFIPSSSPPLSRKDHHPPSDHSDAAESEEEKEDGKADRPLAGFGEEEKDRRRGGEEGLMKSRLVCRRKRGRRWSWYRRWWMGQRGGRESGKGQSHLRKKEKKRRPGMSKGKGENARSEVSRGYNK
jgi:hypothetical protein